MSVQQIPLWKQAPFIRLFPAFAIGIIAGNYFTISLPACWCGFVVSILLLLLFLVFSSTFQHSYYWLTGLLLHVLLISSGLLLIYYNNITNKPGWIGPLLKKELPVVVEIEEPLQEKNKSYKALASVTCYGSEKAFKDAHGKLIIYFSKDAKAEALNAGHHILIHKKLQQIKHNGNPGAFNYAAYAAMQGIYHQVYLTARDFRVIKKGKTGVIKRFINAARQQLINTLRKYIPGKIEAGLAEALLIGYKDDLDRTLLNAYASTGVVHVIAISGLHLGLIYWLLAGIFSLVGNSNKMGIIKPLTIIAGLWIFSFLAGASPSVLRSALMFTFIVAGERSGRKTSIFNSLAASAFLLLCYNPFWLWDTGFQLSYIAVLSLVIFMKPVYDTLYIRNKLLDGIWKLTAVTLAAQVLTFPLCIYLFHQFPVYFLISNLLAIPLSSLILLGEIFLCIISFIPSLAVVSGKCIEWLIMMMNGFIVHVEKLPLSTVRQMEISLEELAMMYLLIVTIYMAVMYKSKVGCYLSLSLILILLSIHSMHNYTANRQKKLIVYDIKDKAIELIDGRNSYLFTSSQMKGDKLSQQFYLEPSLINNRISNRRYFAYNQNIGPLRLGNSSILILNKPDPKNQRRFADLLIITGNPLIDPATSFDSIKCKMIVFDRTNASRNVAAWKNHCINRHISYWDVAEKGAFIINLNSLSFATR